MLPVSLLLWIHFVLAVAIAYHLAMGQTVFKYYVSNFGILIAARDGN